MQPSISFSVRKIMTIMIVAVVFLHIMSLALTIHTQQTSPETLLMGREHGLLRMFDVSTEANLPTWYSDITLGFSSVLLLVIGLVKKGEHDRFAWYWLFMSLVFCFLSIDEASSIHEAVGSFMLAHATSPGASKYNWMIPWGIFTLGFALLYVRFLLGLPRKTAVLMVVAGAIYVAGALQGGAGGEFGTEVAGAVLGQQIGTLSLTDVIVHDLGEWGEMGGILLFNYTLLTYLKDHIGPIVVSLGRSSQTT
jgi:hypothetical protein